MGLGTTGETPVGLMGGTPMLRPNTGETPVLRRDTATQAELLCDVYGMRLSTRSWCRVTPTGVIPRSAHSRISIRARWPVPGLSALSVSSRPIRMIAAADSLT